MNRTKLKDRLLPQYTRGEDNFNTISHIVGGVFAIVALVLAVVFSALWADGWAVVGASVYGATLVLMYAMSSVYHGLKHPMAKRVMQVLDHCTIYFLIAGSYTPILLCRVRETHPGWAWGLFGAVWGICFLATALTAIDLKKYRVFSMICYIGMGWSVVVAARPVMDTVPAQGLWWLLAGGIAYTLGAILYGVGTKVKYMHSVFHLFVVMGSALQYVCILCYVLL